jgi:uncharacterized protein (TIGR00730 family)
MEEGLWGSWEKLRGRWCLYQDLTPSMASSQLRWSSMKEVCTPLCDILQSVHFYLLRDIADCVSSTGPDSETASAHAEEGSLPQYEIYGKTTVVKDMHTRKQMMAREVLDGAEGSGFLALSGGYGTLEELMEVVTWNQLGIHNRGVVVLNIEGYWDGLLEWVRGAVKAGFVGEGASTIIAEAKSAEEAITELRDYKVAKGRFKLEWG